MNRAKLILIKTLKAKNKTSFLIKRILQVFYLTLIPAQIFAQKTVLESVEQAHSVLWNTFVDKYGIIHDYVGELPNPEDCELGRPNAIGWWSPIENGPMFTGIYLAAACERARRSNNDNDKNLARRLAQGLLKCASVSDVPGFIARGIGTDGKCHYPLGSDDQTNPWFLGLHAYFKSGIPSGAECKQIADKMKQVAEVLESTSWRSPCDGAFKGQFRGGFQGDLFRDAARYLFMLRAMYEITNDKIWLDRYRNALAERPLNSEKMRIQICAEGYLPDTAAIKNIDIYQQWIYVGSQGSLAQLAAMETDTTLSSYFKQGLETNAENSLIPVMAFHVFDNNDKKVFGNAKWREGYPIWFPQITQADAAKLAEMGDRNKLGDRKHYEARYMRNPLAAAAIIALAGDGRGRDEVERAICHYDYTRINMAEFLFAECAYYALPVTK